MPRARTEQDSATAPATDAPSLLSHVAIVVQHHDGAILLADYSNKRPGPAVLGFGFRVHEVMRLVPPPKLLKDTQNPKPKVARQFRGYLADPWAFF